jgi:hypothetical protein
MKHAPLFALSIAFLGCAGAEPTPVAPTAPVVDLDQKPPPAPAPVASAAPKAAPPAEADKKPDADKGEEEGAQFGMIGLLNAGAGGDPNDPNVAKGNMWGADIGDAFGAGGLGLVGVGGGGGRGEGIGLGSIGTLGHGAGTGQGYGVGSGRLGGTRRTKPPQVRMGATTVSGRLPPEVVQRIVRQNFGRFRLCYENGLRNNPKLEGKVTVKFTIERDGSVSGVADGGSAMPDKGVSACVLRAFPGLSFPQPEGGKVIVTYPIMFSPGGEERPDYGTLTVPRTQTQPRDAAKPSSPQAAKKP